MNKAYECEIVKDLAISYIEELVSKGTEELVKEHIKGCNDCKEYYEHISEEILNDSMKDKNKDKMVINQFKKINKYIRGLKIILMSIVFLIIIICTTLYIKHQKVENLINNSYSKIEEMKESNNYKLNVKTIERDFSTNEYREYNEDYYYKDGRYKIESKDSIKFYEDNSYEKICVYHDLGTIEYYKQDFIERKKGKIFDIFSDILTYKTLSTQIYSLALNVREDKFNGIECFVIRFGNNDDYKDTWIDKQSFITVRVVNEKYLDFYREEIYSFYENAVNDEQVDTNILNSEKYQNYIKREIINSATKEIKMYNEIQYENNIK